MSDEKAFIIDAKLAAALIAAKSIDETKRAIAALVKAIPSPVWRPVGDTPNNMGPVQMGNDPSTQLIERVINAEEACIDLEARRKKLAPSSPHEAARLLFDVPAKGLAGMKADAVRDLALRTVSVTLAESGTKNPTVMVQDRGIGQHPADVPNSLLALHKSEKMDKPYLVGQYGQGGATTLMHSVYTIFVTRRAPDMLTDGQDDLVGLTVVRFSEGAVKGGTYEYLTNARAMLAVKPADAPAPFNAQHGTRVTHVAYDLHGYTAAYRRQKTGLWALLNAAIFDPILPVHMKGERKVDLQGEKHKETGRIARGNVALLSTLPRRSPSSIPPAPNATSDADGDDDDDGEPGIVGRRGKTVLRYSEDHVQTITDADGSHGKVRFRIWVLGSEQTETYVRAEQAITMTLCGQRHGQEGRDFLRGKCRLGFLSRRMIIQIDADGLTKEGKRRLFPSGREQQRKTSINTLIFGELAEYLTNNEEIQALEDEARQEALASASSRAKDSVCKRLAKMMNRHLRGMSGGAKGSSHGSGLNTSGDGGKLGRTASLRRKRPQTPVPKDPPDDTNLPAIPTTMEIVNSQVTMRAGRTAHAVLKLNAKNGYLADHGEDLRVEFEPIKKNSGDGDAQSKGENGSNGGRANEGEKSKGDGTSDGDGVGGGNGGSGGGGHGISLKGRGRLSGGRARLVFGSDPNAVAGDYEVRVSLTTPDTGDTLVAVGTIEVMPDVAEPAGEEIAEGGLPEINWVKHPDDAVDDEERVKCESGWPQDWTKETVGAVEPSGDSVIFRLNESYPTLKNAIDRRSTGAHASKERVASLKDRYAAAVTYGMWLLDLERKKDQAVCPPGWFEKASDALAKAQLAAFDLFEDFDDSADDQP